MVPTNEERLWVLGVWFVEYLDNSTMTLTCNKKAPSTWFFGVSASSATNKPIEDYATEILGTDDPKEVIKYIEDFIQPSINKGLVKKIYSHQPQSDALDVYQTIQDVFEALGIGMEKVD